MSEEKALELGLEPLARIVGFGVAGVKPQVMGLGPIPSTRKALRHAGITADQIDRVEFNEAFAAQVIPSCKELGISLDRVNVNGGSIAIGHPLGATGARLVSPSPTNCAAARPLRSRHAVHRRRHGHLARSSRRI